MRGKRGEKRTEGTKWDGVEHDYEAMTDKERVAYWEALKIEGNDSGFEKVKLPLVGPPPNADMINQPSHYNYGEIECIDAIKGMLGDDGFKAYCRGNAMKYTWRAGLKFDEVEDLKKASWYNRMAAGDDPRDDEANRARSIAIGIAERHYED